MPWSVSEYPSNIVAIFTSFQERGYRLIDASDLHMMAELLLSARDGVQGGVSQGDASPLETFTILPVADLRSKGNMALVTATTPNTLFVVEVTVFSSGFT